MDAIQIGILKFCFRRLRPTQNSKKVVIMPDILVDKYSFPSGHASRAILLTVLILNIFWPELQSLNNSFYRIGIVFFMCQLAFITCVSRFLLARHYITDVLAGALIGLFNFFFTNSILV